MTTIVFVPGAWHSPSCFRFVEVILLNSDYSTEFVTYPAKLQQRKSYTPASGQTSQPFAAQLSKRLTKDTRLSSSCIQSLEPMDQTLRMSSIGQRGNQMICQDASLISFSALRASILLEARMLHLEITSIPSG